MVQMRRGGKMLRCNETYVVLIGLGVEQQLMKIFEPKWPLLMVVQLGVRAKVPVASAPFFACLEGVANEIIASFTYLHHYLHQLGNIQARSRHCR